MAGTEEASTPQSGEKNPFVGVVDWAVTQLQALPDKQANSKPVTLNDGRKLSEDDSSVTYLFQLYDEYAYLPEDIGVRVAVPGAKRRFMDGKVVLNQEGEVELRISATGPDGDSADLGDEVDVLKVKPDVSDFITPLCQRLIAFSTSPTSATLALISEHHSPRTGGELSPSTVDEALDELEESDVAFIWGPPGCSKTYTLGNLAARLVRKGKRVLMLSGSNVAVDGACLETSGLMPDAPAGTVVRHGHPHDPKFKENPLLTTLGIAESLNPQLVRERDDLREQRRQPDADREAIDARLAEIRSELNHFRNEAVKNADFVATTTAMATLASVFTDGESPRFDVVMYDEAGMALIPQVLFASCLAESRFYAFGDFRQLPPIVDKDAAPALAHDIYDWCNITPCVDSGHAHPLVVMLSEQRRCHPDIASFVSERLYAGLLTTNPQTAASTANLAKIAPAGGRALALLDTSGLPARMLREPGSYKRFRSHYNLLHAIVDVQAALVAKAQVAHVEGEADVAIVVPYAAQAQLVNSILSGYREAARHIRCSTVHGFQGSSAQVVVYDTVDTGKKLGYLVGTTEDRLADRLLNVALTRARGKVVVVANLDAVAGGIAAGNREKLMLVDLLDGLAGTGAHVRGDDLLRSVLHADTCLRAFDDDAQACSALAADIDAASKTVGLYVPDDETCDPALVGKVSACLRHAVERGCAVTLECGDPQRAKAYKSVEGVEVVNTDAFLPIAVMDGRTLWFGPTGVAGLLPFANKEIATPSVRIESPAAASFIESMQDSRSKEKR